MPPSTPARRCSGRYPTSALTVVVAVAAATLLGGARFDLGVVTRSTVLLTGIAVLATATLAPSAAWARPALTPIVTWLLGTDATTRQVRPWAVLLAAPGSTSAWVVAVTTAVVGAAAYLLRPRLTSGWSTTGQRPARG